MVEYNLAKVNVEGSNPFFCFILYHIINGPKGSIWYFHLKLKGIIIELTFINCDYRLIGKSFIFQVNIVGSSPTNHKIMEKWLSG